MGVSLNDLYLGAINKAIYDYAKMKGKSTESNINYRVPCSLHDANTDLVNFIPSNGLSLFETSMLPKPTMDEAIKEAQRSTTKLRDPKLLWFMAKLNDFKMSILPEAYIQTTGKAHVPKMTILTSNMAASREKLWEYDGKKVHWITMLNNNPCNQLPLCSLADAVMLSWTNNKARFEDGAEILKLVEANLTSELQEVLTP